jgi:hypothetical protein
VIGFVLCFDPRPSPPRVVSFEPATDGCVSSQSARARTIGSISIFLHHAASLPLRCASHFASKFVQVGAVGYFYNQISTDRGCAKAETRNELKVIHRRNPLEFSRQPSPGPVVPCDRSKPM